MELIGTAVPRFDPKQPDSSFHRPFLPVQGYLYQSGNQFVQLAVVLIYQRCAIRRSIRASPFLDYLLFHSRLSSSTYLRDDVFESPSALNRHNIKYLAAAV